MTKPSRWVALALAAATCFGQTQKSPAPAAKVPAAARTAPSPTFDKAKFEAFVRHLLLWGPQIGVAVAEPQPSEMPGFRLVKVTGSYQKVSLDEIFYVSSDGRKIVRGTLFDIAKNPFAAEIAKLKTDLQPSFGTPGAPVVLVLFSDFQCAYCREEAKQIRANLIKTYPKEVRLYFKDFPIEQLHPWAKPASIAGRCVFRQDAAAFWDYHDWIFDKQAEITPETLRTKVTEWVQGKGLDAGQFTACFDNKSTLGEVEKSLAEGKELRVSSTPTMFVNGRQIPGSVPFQQLKGIIDFELEYAKTSGENAEKCCELTLPVPGKK
ncbi:thioredoxin domain-containing protein [uncultured Paludibaculum sp.]|uniref:thioredoxin domain-containing protein n=1 Tax=uncultured Paludibaculum sp. TaxID=1765020 RepID=UPI002AAB9394|nr:thioredoxin domain-containing protein [uncultured Paludibaculum sp.]